MTTTAQNSPYPDIAPPLGAEADIWEGSPPRWERCVFAEPRCVVNGTGDPLRSPVVVAVAVQRANGSIASTAVSVEVPANPGLTSTEARELAAVLIAVADQVDGWAAA